MALPVFKTGLAGVTLAGRFDSFPPPPTAHLNSPAEPPGSGSNARVVPALSPWRIAIANDNTLMIIP